MFRSVDIKTLLKNKHVVVMGDSVQRCFYKDLVLFLQSERQLTVSELKTKSEDHFPTGAGEESDNLVFRTEKTNGKVFTEIREFQSSDGFHLVQYYFLTRCYDERMECILTEMSEEVPDLIIMNSCLWDITRYGPNGFGEYKRNISHLLQRMRDILPQTSTFLWLTTMPLSSNTSSGFLTEEVQWMAEILPIRILEANQAVVQLCIHYGFDVCDMHYYMRCTSMINHREKDGVHWDSFATRHITELIVAFLYDAWQIVLPASATDTIALNTSEADLKAMRHFMFNDYPSYLGPTLKRYKIMHDCLQEGVPIKSPGMFDLENEINERERNVREQLNELSSMNTDLKVEHDEQRKLFRIIVDGTNECKLEYEKVNETTLDLYHTEVPPQFQGHGLARRLVEASLEYASFHNLKVVPTCSYVAKFFAENQIPKYVRLLAKR